MARAITLGFLDKYVRASPQDEAEALNPGQMRLYSFYKPSVKAGTYRIEAVQRVRVPELNDPTNTIRLDISNYKRETPDQLFPQRFTVMAPQFSIDLKLINSYYPPNGHQDEGRILPHIVFNDPHLPWERSATDIQPGDGGLEQMYDPIPPKAGSRSIVPWLAVVVFDAEELKITSSDASALGFNAPDRPQLDVLGQQSSGSFAMPVTDYLSLSAKAPNRMRYEDGYDEKEIPNDVLEAGAKQTTQVIFPEKKVFNAIFGDVKKHRFLAHVRQVNTQGFPDAGFNGQGHYSVIFSHRTGKLLEPTEKPETRIAHLVSIEHVPTTITKTQSAGAGERIGMVSLFSWLYTALPAHPVNFVETMQNLGAGRRMLRPPQAPFDALAKLATTSKEARMMLERLTAGYTIVRWRSETGEETVAFNRGPLVPVPAKTRRAVLEEEGWPDCSNNSKNYQILDSSLGLIDLSYSSAWQLGKTLAISDPVFSSALLRFRSLVNNTAGSSARLVMNKVDPPKKLLFRLRFDLIRAGELSKKATVDPEQWFPPATGDVHTLLNSPFLRREFQRQVGATVETNSQAGKEIFNEFNLTPANNDDWRIIHTWISDKLYLSDIPMHYLFTDPSYLPAESLRFFHIDDRWLDCLIDGALSVANHMSETDDNVRRIIKLRYNAYLAGTIKPHKPVGSNDGYQPQIPRFGFVLRSKLVKAMPDLKIGVKWKQPGVLLSEPRGADICRLTKLDETTIMCLLDQDLQFLQEITFTQPAHQMRFSFGESLDVQRSKLELLVRRLYAPDVPAGWQQGHETTDISDLPEEPGGNVFEEYFDKNSHCIQVERLVTRFQKVLADDSQHYKDDYPNSAMFGLQMNDPSYYFSFKPKLPDNHVDLELRQLWVNPPREPPGPPPERAEHPSAGAALPTRTPLPAAIPPTITVDHRFPNRPASVTVITNPTVPVGGGSIPSTTVPLRQFTLLVYPDYKSRTSWDPEIVSEPDYIPTKSPWLLDLIFRIRRIRPSSAAHQYRLRELTVEIPNANIPPAEEPLHEVDYDGPGARMLSNLRYIPMVNRTPKTLEVRLIPRKAADDATFVISDDRTRDASFRLSECNIAATRHAVWVDQARRFRRGVVVVKLHEYYQTDSGVRRVTANFKVYKHDVEE